MKELVMIWNRLAGRHYSAVNTNSSGVNANENEDGSNNPGNVKNARRKSSIVVNRFFSAALPVHRDGRPGWSKNIFVLMTLGLLGLLSGCFVLFYQPYDFIFKFKVVFSEGSEIFELWRKPPVELYLKVYLFNVTNHEEYLSGEASKLRVQQVGPYVYKESFEHGNVKFLNNGTLSAVPLHPLKYMPDMSNGTEEDLLVLPNIALLSITNVMRDASYFTRLGLNMLIRQTDTQPLVQMTAREFMFGYKSTLVTLGNHVMPSWIKFEKLGLIDRMYDFDGDYETVYTGEKDIRLTGLIDTYNGDVNLPQWTGSCANVNGASDGAKFPSYIKPNDTLLFFRKSMCRSGKLRRIGEKTIKGLKTYKYKFIENSLDNGAYNPENKCFCRQGYCLKPGLIDVTDCYYGFPIALSYPHFYQSDPSLLEAVDGLHPDAEKHESYFYIQPKSGLPVDLASRFQINMALQDVAHMAHVEKFANLVLPMLWFEISMAELPESMNTRFLLYLNVLPVFQEVCMYTSFVSGIAFLIWGVLKILLHQPHPTAGSGQWLDAELQRKRLSFLNDKQGSIITKEMETYYSSLLDPKDDNLTLSSELTTVSCLREEIV